MLLPFLSPKAKDQKKALCEGYEHAGQHLDSLERKLKDEPVPKNAETYTDLDEQLPSGGSEIEMEGSSSFYTLAYRVEEEPYGYHVLYCINDTNGSQGIDILSITTMKDERGGLLDWVSDLLT